MNLKDHTEIKLNIPFSRFGNKIQDVIAPLRKHTNRLALDLTFRYFFVGLQT